MPDTTDRPEEIEVAEQLTPNETLAIIVTDALMAEGIIPEDKQEELQEKLIEGTVSMDDWRLWVELTVEEEELGERGENDG